MRLAKALGSSRVIVVGRGSRLQSAKKLGADDIIDINEQDPVEAVRALTEIGADEVFESSGAKNTINQAICMCCKGGKVVMLGVAPWGVMEEIPLKHTTANEITIFGSKANPNVSKKVLKMLAAGQVVVKDMITHRFALEEFGMALDTFINRKENAIKVVILPNGEE